MTGRHWCNAGFTLTKMVACAAVFATARLRRVARNRAGTSLVDILVVVSVTGVLLAIAVPSIQTALLDARANAGMRAVQGHLREARDSAITLRRAVEVRFIGQNEIRSTRLDGGGNEVFTTTILENGMRFRLTPGVPDTPDAFGRTRAVAFESGRRTYFQPDGSLTDAAGLPMSGTLFLGMTQTQKLTARAVTVLGPSGRVQAYRWDGSAWR